MPAIEIIGDAVSKLTPQFIANNGEVHAVGETAGQALDALNALVATKPIKNSLSVVVIQQSLVPDAYFSAEQKRRLDELMVLWRDARDNDRALVPELQSELDALIAAEWDGAIQRSKAIGERLGI